MDRPAILTDLGHALRRAPVVGLIGARQVGKSDREALVWLREYVTTFLERDVPSLGLRIPAPALRRFWTMLAHVHGRTLNASELGRSLEITDKTVRHYVDVLAQAFMVRQL